MKKAMALILALILSVSVLVLSVSADTSVSLNLTKTAQWTNEARTEADIIVDSSAKVNDPTNTKVLMVGTLCSGHAMETTTFKDTINVIAQKADVRYYAVSASNQSEATEEHGDLKKGESRSQGFTLSKPNHYALKKFITILYDELVTQKNTYDYILFEFDSARIAIDRENRKNSVSIQSTTGNVFDSVSTEMTAVANALSSYYSGNKIIWVTDISELNGETYSFAYTAPNNRFDQGSIDNMSYLTKKEFKALASVFAPDDYKTFDTTFSTYKSGTRYSLTDIDSAYKTNYTELSVLTSFISNLIQEKTYEIDFSDTIAVDRDLEIVSAKLQTSSNGGSTWADYTAVTPTIDTATGKVTAKLTGLTDAETRIRLVIHVRDKGTFKTTDDKSVTSCDPNDGPAKVTVSYPDLPDVTETATTVLPLSWTNQYKVTTVVTNGTTTTPVTYLEKGETASSDSTPGTAGYKVKSVKVNGVYLTGTDFENYVNNRVLNLENVTEDILVEVVYYGHNNVSYEYEGTLIPNGAQDILDTESQYAVRGYDEGTTVTVASEPSVSGYSFSGWSSEDVTVLDGAFTMPIKDVVLKGSWDVVPDLSVSADVRIGSVSVDGKTEPAGSTLTYVAEVTNNHVAGETATDVVVTMKVPDGLYDVVPADGGTYDAATGTVSWTIPSIKAGNGNSKELTFTAKVPDDLKTDATYKTEAVIDSAYGETYTGSGKTSNEVSVTAVTYVGVTVKKEWSDTWNHHTSDTVKVQLYENGKAKGSPIVLNNSNRTVTVTELRKYDSAGKEITYTVKELDASGNAVEENGMNGKYRVSYYTGTTAYSLTVKNDYVFDKDDFDIEKAVSDATAKPGDEIIYTVTIKNKNSYQSAVNITLKDVLLEGLTVTAVTPAAGTTCVPDSDGVYVWDIPSIGGGSSLQLKIKVKIPENVNNVRYENTAVLSQIDGNAADKSSNTVITDVKTFTVTKKWLSETGADENSVHSTDAVAITLKRDGVFYNSASVGSSTGWSYTWVNLPLYKDGSDSETSVYTVEESIVPTGFDVSYGSATGDSAEIINKRKAVKVNYVYTGTDIPAYADDILPDGGTYGYGYRYTSSPASYIQKSPISRGYTFAGWYNEEECTSFYADGTSLTSDRTLYGLFTRNKVTISFDYKGNVPETETEPEDVTLNQYDTINPSSPSSTGYEFTGWYKDPECTQPWDPEMELENSTTVYGNWEAVPSFDISADVKKDGVSVNHKTVPAGSDLTYETTVVNTNEGNATLYDTVVTMSVPEGLEDIVPQNGGVYDDVWRTVTWTIPVLEAGEENGKTFTYTAKVPDDITEITEYDSEAKVTYVAGEPYTGADGVSDTLVTKAMPLVEKTVTKTWSDTWESHKNDKVSVQLYADGAALGDPFELNFTDRSRTITSLPKYDADEKLITYTFRELSVTGGSLENGDITGRYKVSYAGDGTDSVTVHNDYQFDENDFTVSKNVSKEIANPGEMVVYTVTLNSLKENDTATDIVIKDVLPEGLTVVCVNPGEGSSCTDGKDGTCIWTVKEISQDKPAELKIYAKISENANDIRFENTVSITEIEGKSASKSSNTVHTDVKTYRVCKEWLSEKGEDEAARHYDESLSISLYRDGTLYDTTTVDNACSWAHTWSGLPLYKDGSDTEESVYTVKENNVPDGFALTYTDVGKDFAKITNTRKTIKVDYVFTGTEQPEKAADILPGTDTIAYASAYTSSPVSTIKESPVTKGYTFAGWYNENECKTSYADGTNLYEDKTLYGLFTRNKVTISFEYAGHVPEDAKAPEDTVINQYESYNPTEPSAKGYEFTGWYKDPECTEEWDPTDEVESDTKLYGLWKVDPSFDLTADVKKDGVSVNNKTVPAGSTLTYENTVTNTNEGNATIYNSKVTMSVPEGLYDVVPQNGGVYDATWRTVTWDIPVLEPGEENSRSFFFNAKVPEDLTEIEVYNSQAKITVVEGETYTGDDGVSEILVTKAMPLIQKTVTKEWSDTWVNHLADTVKIQLYADGKAYGDAFRLTYTERSRTVTSLPKYTESGTPVTYTFRELDDDGKEISDGGVSGRYKVNYWTSESGDDTTVSNNYIVVSDDLDITKSVSDALAAPGSVIDYTITVTNGRTFEKAEKVRVSDILPAGLTVLSTSQDKNVEKDDATGAYIWTIPDIGPGESEELVIKALIPATATDIRYTNTAVIISIDGDPCNKESNDVSTDVKTFTVRKVWLDETGEDESSKHNNDSLSIILVRDGKPYDEATLTKNNGWAYTWNKLPAYIDGSETKSVYTVYENVEFDASDSSYSYYQNSSGTVTNRRKTVKVTYHFSGDDMPSNVSKLLPDGGEYGYGFEYSAAAVKTISEYALGYGYEFTGWYTDSGCTTKYKDGTALTEDLDLYGTFKRVDIDLTFSEYSSSSAKTVTKEMTYGKNLTIVPNGGVYNGTSGNTVYYNVTEDMKVKDPTPPSGKKFLGWSYYKDNDGNVTLTANYDDKEENPNTGDSTGMLLSAATLAAVSLGAAVSVSGKKRKTN